MMTETCPKTSGEYSHRMRTMTPEDHMKRTRVLEAIAVLEKNKIPASSDNIMLQMGDGGICRKELSDVISELYTSGFINKNKGNVITSPEKPKPRDSGSESSTAESEAHSAGISIPHDGLPKISSVHSYCTGRKMSYPIDMNGKEEKIIYHPPHHRPHQHPRFFHPPPHVMYHPPTPTGAPPSPSSQVMSPHQVIPIHVPYEHAMGETPHEPGSSSYPVAYYPFWGSPDGKQMQWMFYPMSIPVNAVRPMVSENNCPQKENVTPCKGSNIDQGIMQSSTKINYAETPEKVIKDHSAQNPIVISDDCCPSVSLPSEKKSFMQHVDKMTQHTSHGNSSTKNVLNSEINGRSKEAVLAKKRKQLLGIVDRVTEVAARKQNDDNIVRMNNVVPVVTFPSVVPTTNASKYGNELMDSYIDEIALEAAKIRDKQKRERDKIYHEAGIQPSFMSKIKNRLDVILKNTEEERNEMLKEYSSSDAVRSILSSPPEFISRSMERGIGNVDGGLSTPNTIVIESPHIHSHHETIKIEQKDIDIDESLFDPIDLEKLKKADNFNPNLIVHDVLGQQKINKMIFIPDGENLYQDDDKNEKKTDIMVNPAEVLTNIGECDDEIKENIELLINDPFEDTVLIDVNEENDEIPCIDVNHTKEQRAELKQYFTRKKLKLKLEELRLKRNMNRSQSVLAAQNDRVKRSRPEVYYKEGRTNFF